MTICSVVDVFCGVGGLAHGFMLEDFSLAAGIDSDPFCKYAFEKNNDAKFIEADVEKLSGKVVSKLYPNKAIKILIGCAPCQPFSNYTNKLKKKNRKQWFLLAEFGRIIKEIQPEIVSMENVPNLGGKEIFDDFVDLLKKNEYHVTRENVYCPNYGVPQRRWRLVLLASKLGEIRLISPTHLPEEYVTVKEAIGRLPRISAGETYRADSLHRASVMSDTNMKRIKKSVPGGTWKDWPKNLVSPCHLKKSGNSYYNVYGRMEWHKISPTITTEFTGFGNGRFGHPEQDRALSLREGALLQTFPMNYEFFKPATDYRLSDVAKYIGNAVPVQLARAIAKSIRIHLDHYAKKT
jgi:DNA (cytosine-5)-methyltransferase 1